MKLNKLLLAIVLLFAVNIGWAQTVDYISQSGSGTFMVTELNDGILEDATTITIKGNWRKADKEKLRWALTGNKYSGGKNLLTNVIFEKDAIINDMAGLFSECNRLVSITMPTTANNAEVSFKQAFLNCNSLSSSIDLSAFTNISDMTEVFRGCTQLENIKLPAAINNAKVSFMNAFTYCYWLSSGIDLSPFVNISNMTEAFLSCGELTSVQLPTVVNNSAVSFESTYLNCSKLSCEIDLHPFTNISNLNRTFEKCAKLTTVKLPAVTNNTAVGFMGTFANCSSLSSDIDLRPFTNISNLAGTFSYCSQLSSVQLPIVVNNSAVSFSNTFSGCSKLTSEIDLRPFTNISSMGGTFNGCEALTSIKLPVEENTMRMDFWATFSNCSALKEIDLRAFTNILIMRATFIGCSKLSSIELPATKHASPIRFDDAFSYCKELTEIDLRSFINVTSYYYTFEHCPKLEKVYLGSASSDIIENGYKETFGRCPETCKVYLPNGVESVPTEWETSPVTFVYYEPTNINHMLETDIIPAVSYVYSIDGKLLKTVSAQAYGTLIDGLLKGLYIINGKKVVVK